MVPSSLDGLTDEQLAELEAQQGQPEITTGLVDRLAAPSRTEGFTDRELEALPVLSSTPFAAQRGIELPPEAPSQPEPLSDYELNQLEEENYRRVDYIMPEEEFRQYWTRRKEENNEVGRFIEGVGQGAAGMLAMIPEAGREIRDGMVGMVTDPVNQVQRNVQTGAEVVRKAGINMVQLFDWVGNKVNDVGTWAQRRGLKRQALAKQLEQEGRLTGDELRDAEIIAAAASEAEAMEPTPLEEEEDFQKAYERYQREKALEQEFAGVTDFQIGASKATAPAASVDAYQITDEKPAETLSMLGSMAIDPINLLPVGAGALSKLRVLRRTATLAGAPLRGLQRAADATADLAERAEFGISSRVQDITGLTAKQQAALGAGAAGAAVYADQAGGGGNFTTAVTAIGSVLPGLRYGGAIIRKTGAAAGGAATIIREAGVGGIGTARAEAAADLLRMTAIPERYRKYFTGYVDGTDSTLKRVAQDAGNPEALRRVARFADRAGVTTAARMADDVTSGAVAAGITGAPFAALQPDAERAGEVLGGIMALGGVAGVAGSAVRRGAEAADADIARMMADVYAVGGNVDALSALPHGTLDRMAAMQGVLAGKVDFVPLKADEYRMNKDVSATGGELAAGLFLEKDANGRARVFINLDARKSAGGVEAIVPHEIGHAILTSNVLDGQPRNDLRNLVNQQYGPDGVTARGREYVGRLVDADIQNGTTGELPQVLTEQEFRDLESGNKSPADIAKGRKMEPSERERLINERFEELSQRSIERGEDALDWARDEIIAETFASEAPAIDFRAIRRDAAFPRLAESMLAAGGRVLEMMGVNLDRGTGRMLDNPSVLFRDNPLFQDRIMQKRVKEYVRAYDQYLVGLEEAGSATPRGVELARSNRPEDLGRSTHVKLRDEGRGVLENDFLFQKPDGTYAYKPQPIINAAEANRAAQIKTLYDARKFVPVNSTEFGKRKVNGREVIGGPVLPPQFDLFTQFPQHVREFARAMEASRAEGGSWNIDYNAIGTGSSGRYRITNMGAVRAIQREIVPFGWQVTKQNHLLAVALDLNALRSAAMKAINKGELGIFNNDMARFEAVTKEYLANHRAGRPGETGIGIAARDAINGLIGTGTAVQRAANPLYAELNPRGSIRTWRIDRLNDAQPSGRTGYFFDYDKINNNRMPQQIPREAQGMPELAPRAQMMADSTDPALRQPTIPTDQQTMIQRDPAGQYEPLGMLRKGANGKWQVFTSPMMSVDKDGRQVMLPPTKVAEYATEAQARTRAEKEFFTGLPLQEAKQYLPARERQAITEAQKRIAEVAKNNPEAARLEVTRDERGLPKVGLIEDADGNPVLDDRGNQRFGAIYKGEKYGLRDAPGLSKDEARAVQQAADLMEADARRGQQNPAIAKGIGWYGRMRGWLQQAYGATIERFGQLLGATSARTPVDMNFIQAREALQLFGRGAYDDLLQRFDAFVMQKKADADSGKMEADWRKRGGKGTFKLEDEYRKQVNSFKEVPLRANGKKYNANSTKVLHALYGNWIAQTKGPTTPNFAGNLTGRTFKATIDVWAARNLRRLLYQGKKSRWRILPEQEQGVTDADFFFSQKVYDEVAKRMGVIPDDLQALQWFNEKDIWEASGWTDKTGAEKSSFDKEAGKLNVDRYQVGLTTFTTPEQFDPAVQRSEMNTFRESVRGLDGLEAARITESEGLYGDVVEPSFDVEFSVNRRGDVSPSIEPVMRSAIETARRNNQKDVIISLVVDELHPNARPMVEVGFKSAATKAQVDAVTAAFRANGIDGFTIARNERGDALGVRSQYVPEISARYDTLDHLNPDQFAINSGQWVDKARKAIANLENQDNVSYRKEGYVSTAVYGIEEYTTATPADLRGSNAKQELGRRRAILAAGTR
jgi:hypothetical protein